VQAPTKYELVINLNGLLRALAVTSTKRIAILPDVPTMEEAGVPGQVQEAPQCVWAPAGTPHEIIDLLYREIARAVASPDLKKKMAAIGYEPSTCRRMSSRRGSRPTCQNGQR
jgi:tripartite-type tricarboxylate transporter receptor subunit TctC